MNIEALEQLASDLETGNLSIDHWDFGITYHKNEDGTIAGCALAFLVASNPKKWEEMFNGIICFHRDTKENAVEYATRFFEIDELDASRIFVNGELKEPEDVAKEIRELLPISCS